MANNLKVLTFNAWGPQYISKDLELRMKAISVELAKGDYDIVALQEIWSVQHYELIHDKVKDVLPYTHYFHSGIVGSGCATLSRYPIKDTFFQQHPHNGYFWDVMAGDWFSGKGVGCCVIQHPLKRIYVFNTHFHADYFQNTWPGVEEIRSMQCYQLSQFICRTTNPSDTVLVCGDINHEPNALGTKALLQLSNLNDTYEIASTKLNKCFTVNAEFNPYMDAQQPVSRIDYILSSKDLECLSCDLALQKIPNSDFHFSDHEGYTATITIKDGDVIRSLENTDTSASRDVLQELLKVLSRGEEISNKIHWRKVYLSLLLFFMLIVLPIVSVDMFHRIFPSISTWTGKFVFVLQVVCAVFSVIYLWVNVVLRWEYVNVFRNVTTEIMAKLRVLHEFRHKFD